VQPDGPPLTIPLFLYGTLRRGGAQHGLIAPYLEFQTPARLWGRLYHLAAGYPAVEVPEDAILARGTGDALTDASIAWHNHPGTPRRSPGDWGWVEGDYVRLREPARCLPVLDDYEDFRPGERCLYQRVLVSVASEAHGATAWLYTKEATAGDIRIPSGIWRPEPF